MLVHRRVFLEKELELGFVTFPNLMTWMSRSKNGMLLFPPASPKGMNPNPAVSGMMKGRQLQDCHACAGEILFLWACHGVKAGDGSLNCKPFSLDFSHLKCWMCFREEFIVGNSLQFLKNFL